MALRRERSWTGERLARSARVIDLAAASHTDALFRAVMIV
jgi:hypothetical protein